MKNYVCKSLGVLLLMMFCCSLDVAHAQTLTANTSGSGYVFSLTGTLPALHKSGAYYRAFLSYSDGHYFIGDYNNTGTPAPDLVAYVRNYMSSHTGMPVTLELTPAYDDNLPPGGRYIYYFPGGGFNPIGSGTDNGSAVNMHGGNLVVESSRNIVASNYITYAVTVQNTSCTANWTGQVKLDYPEPLFDLSAVDGSSASGGTGTIFKQVTLLPNEQKSVLFELLTSSTAPIGMRTSVTATMLPDGTSPCNTYAQTEVSSAVTDSHDPNRKTPDISVVNRTSSYIDYEVTFQNDGKGMAQTVIVKDELDLYLENTPPLFLSASHSLNNQVPIQVGPRSYQWQFDAINLKGTHQIGYLSSFFEPSTKGFIRFRVKLEQSAPCNAVLNRATIYFQCNPPIETNLSITPIPCNDITGTIDSCAQLGPLWLENNTTFVDGAPISNLLNGYHLPQSNSLSITFPSGPWTYKWYPSEGLSAPTSSTTNVAMAHTGTYALVASQSCNRIIYLVPVITDAGLQTTSLLVQDDPRNCMANLVISGGSPGYAVNWSYTQNGVTGMATGTSLNLSGKQSITATVTDAIGCTATFSPKSCCSWWCRWNWTYVGAATLALLVLLLFYRIFAYRR